MTVQAIMDPAVCDAAPCIHTLQTLRSTFGPMV